MFCIIDLVQGDYIPHVCLFQRPTNKQFISKRYALKQKNTNIFKLHKAYFIMH